MEKRPGVAQVSQSVEAPLEIGVGGTGRAHGLDKRPDPMIGQQDDKDQKEIEQ